MSSIQDQAKAAATSAAAAEKQAEKDLKTPSGLNWLAVAGIALVANLVGVLLHI